MIRLPFEILLALRYLRPKRTFVSVISLISVVGVMLGVAVLIIVISVMTGFDRQFRDRILGINAHLRIKQAHPMVNFEKTIETVASFPGVRGVAPYVMGQVLVETQPTDGTGLTIAPLIRGVDTRYEESVTVLPKSIVRGEFDLKGNRIVIGKELSAMLGVGVGDILSVYSASDLRNMRESWQKNQKKEGHSEAYLPTDYEISGIFDVGFYDFNDKFIVCSLGNAQDMHGLGDAVHGLFVMLKDPFAAGEVRNRLQERLGLEFELTTWDEENAYILDALYVEKNVMFYLLFFIMVVAAFGITSALITFVVQKTREIGILKALGATSQQIMAIFLSQSLTVGLIGVSAGFGLGMLAVEQRNEFLTFLRRVTGFELFPARIYNFSELPALIIPSDIALICGLSLLICLLAGLFPAWNAGRLQPVEALRHE